MLGHDVDVDYKFSKCFGVLIWCRVLKEIGAKHIHGCHNVFITTRWRYFRHQINLHGIFGRSDGLIGVFKGEAGEATVNSWLSDAFFTWHHPLRDLLRHFWKKNTFPRKQLLFWQFLGVFRNLHASCGELR